jgi:dUTP pyrophosphatase
MFLPKQGTKQAAGWDLAAAEETVLTPYEPQLVKLLFAAALPDGTAMLILPRSSSPKRQLFVSNSPGLIDSDYRGPWHVWLTWIPHPAATLEIQSAADKLRARPREQLLIEKGERVAQGVLIRPIDQQWVEVDNLTETERGSHGFGHTGR